MEDITTLDRLPVGERARVVQLTAPEAQSRRLQEFGFVPGGEVKAVQESPWGDPVAYAVCGAVIALRRIDAQKITVQKK